MAKPAWKDTSSYSRDDKNRTPSTWELKIGSIHIIVHRHMHFEPTAWLLSCHELRIEQQLLKNTDIEEAKPEAIRVVWHHVSNILDALNIVMEVEAYKKG